MFLRIVLVFLIKNGNVIPTCTNFERNYFKLVYECYCARLNFKFGIYRWQNIPKYSSYMFLFCCFFFFVFFLYMFTGWHLLISLLTFPCHIKWHQPWQHVIMHKQVENVAVYTWCKRTTSKVPENRQNGRRWMDWKKSET